MSGLPTGPNLHWLGQPTSAFSDFGVVWQCYDDFSAGVSLFQIPDSLRNLTQAVTRLRWLRYLEWK